MLTFSHFEKIKKQFQLLRHFIHETTLVHAASEMSFDDYDKRTVVFRAKAGEVLDYCDKREQYQACLNIVERSNNHEIIIAFSESRVKLA